MSRIKGRAASLSYDTTLAFFERRAQGVNCDPNDCLAVTVFRDKETAGERHRAELFQALPLLGIDETSRVLEIGCGAGRWAISLLRDAEHPVQKYIGVDFSPSLITMAQKACGNTGTAQFFVMAADALDEAILGAHAPYSHVIICALLLYLNDDAVRALLAALARITVGGAILYVREPICLGDERLTLVDEYSEALQDRYNAVYRLDSEYQALLTTDGAFELRCDQLMHDQLFKSFSETQHKLYVATRR